MKIDLTCPVELWQFSTPTQEEPECTFVMNNLSEKTVISVQVTLVCHDEAGELLFRQIERIQGLSAGAGERFTAMLLPTQWEEEHGVELVIEKVWFDDATIWRRGTGILTEYQSNALPSGRRLDQLRFVAGKDAAGYPQEQDHCWVCVCGRANAKTRDRCCRCGRHAEAVFASYEQSNVDRLIAVHDQKLLDIAKKAREDAGKLAEERDKERQKKKATRKNTLKISLSAICVVAAVVIIVVWGIPTIRYNQADALLGEAKFDEARTAFASMGDYRDAKEQLERINYLEAKSWFEAGDSQSLQKAAAAFELLGDYEDSRNMFQLAIYRQGDLALEAGEYESAAEYFQALGSYEDSEEKLQELTYLQAKQLVDGESYAAAEALFVELGGYKDSQENATLCKYTLALAAEEAGEYDQAIEQYTAVGEYKDAPERLRIACYLLAEQKLAQNDLEAAGMLYLQAGEHSDARLKANDSLYQLAQQYYGEGNYEKAKQLFTQIVSYLDSESMAWDCDYRQAEQAQASGDYQAAITLYTSVSSHKDALDKAEECRYLLATESVAKGDLAEAETQFAALGTYKDSAKLLKQTRYQLGQKAASEGDYPKAVEIFEELGNYTNSPTRLKDCRYQLAKNALLDKEYEVAIEGFTLLGKYEDSEALLETAIFEYDMSRMEAGDTEQVTALLSTAEVGSEEREALVDIAIAEAQKKKDEGDLEGANAMLLPLQDEPQAKERYLAWQYESAGQKMNAGLYNEAGKIFLALGAYQDAAEQSAQCYQLYYGVLAEPAREAFTRKDYPAVIETLDGVNMEDLPQEYQDLLNLYEQACYAYAEQLYQDNKPYEALPYYQRIPNYKNVEQKLERRCYLLLGLWKTGAGEEAEFLADGTCRILGEEFTFNVDGYALSTGKDKESLTPTHRLTIVTDKSLTLRDTRNGQNKVYKFERVEGTEPLQATPAPAATRNELEDMLVQEEDDATPSP